MASLIRDSEASYGSSTSNLLQPRGHNPASPNPEKPLLSARPRSPGPSLSDRFALAPNPAEWGSHALLINTPEPDDYLHNPDPKRDRNIDAGGHIFTARGISNLGFMAFLVLGMLMLFAGYPVYSHFTKHVQSTQGAFNVGGTNATGQVASLPGLVSLIDVETPASAYTKASYMNPNDEWDLVFSDEFNLDGRTFYPGDDPFWEATDFHYWGTNDLEWYDPKQATTKGGYLRLTLAKADPASNHDLSYTSGMIQSWNKFCFTGGIIEVSVQLPGTSKIPGLWPAVWTMGNLGRAGYGASLEGTWPYSYDSCDVGTLPNQTYPGTSLPQAAVEKGDPSNFNMLSYLGGQRLSACTCPGESHPGPARADGSYVGRAAPEIDIFEATIDGGVGKVSQSGQWAPFNAQYDWLNTTANLIISNPAVTELNGYKGGVYQQTTSGLSMTNQNCYELESGCFSIYAFEYKPGFDDSYITWAVNDTVTWTLMGAGMGPDKRTEIGARPVPQEPMYIIMNLGFSLNFGWIDFNTVVLPTAMLVDYVRVYQPKDAHNIGCDPPDFPTAAYIDTYLEAYTNPNLTVWGSPAFNQSMPKNKLVDTC